MLVYTSGGARGLNCFQNLYLYPHFVYAGSEGNIMIIFVPISLSNSYTMGCPPVLGDNPLALASGLSCVQVGNHG